MKFYDFFKKLKISFFSMHFIDLSWYEFCMVIEEHTFSNAVICFSHQAPHTSLPRKVSWATWRMSVTNKEVWISRITFLFLLLRIQYSEVTARHGILRFFPWCIRKRYFTTVSALEPNSGFYVFIIPCRHAITIPCHIFWSSFTLCICVVVSLLSSSGTVGFVTRGCDWACLFRCSAGLRVDIPQYTFLFFSSKCLSKSPVYSLRLL